MSDHPKVAGIICNYNRREDVLQCLGSAKNLNYRALDIFVVDNASTDGSAHAISQAFPEIRVLDMHANKGSCGGFNEGMRYALALKDYKYLFLIDNDIFLDPQALLRLVEVLESDTSLGAAGSKIYHMDQPQIIQEFGGSILWGSPRQDSNLRHRRDRPAYQKDIRADYLASCSLLVKRKVCEEVGLMDEGYFLYFDDVDWCHRMVLSGFGLRAVASSRIWHKQGSNDRRTGLPLYYGFRNSIHFFNQYLSDKLWRRSTRVLLRYAKHISITCSLYGKIGLEHALDKALDDVIAGRRGKAEGLDLSLPCASSLWSYESLPKRPIFVYSGRFQANLKSLVKRKLPQAEIHSYRPGEKVHNAVVLLPCAHVFNNNPYISLPGAMVYWADISSNLLPPGKEGLRIRAVYQRRMESFLQETLSGWQECLKKQRRVKLPGPRRNTTP